MRRERGKHFPTGLAAETPDLGRQVELPLAKEERAGSFLEIPAIEDIMTVTLTAAGS
jgi:hypothetical protein